MAKNNTKIILIGILSGIAGWAFYSLLNQAVKDVLAMIGITNFYAQHLTIILVIALIFFLIWHSTKKTVKAIIK